MRYTAIRLKQKREEEVYRNYVTDALWASLQRGMYISNRYADIINPDRNVVEEDRSSEEIINSIRSKLKGTNA